MPRPKEFDPDVALDRAVDVFWSRGYGGTSIQHLVDALGVNRGSLYATFGDKHGLYLAALDRYRQSEVVQIVDLLEQPGPVKRVVRRPFDAVVLSVAEGRGGRGCLVCNAAVEQAADDADVEAAVWASLGRIAGLHFGAATRPRARSAQDWRRTGGVGPLLHVELHGPAVVARPAIRRRSCVTSSILRSRP